MKHRTLIPGYEKNGNIYPPHQPCNRNVPYLLPILKFAAKRMKRHVSTFAAN